MQSNPQTLIIIGVMSLVVFGLRAAPFVLFRGHDTPDWVNYLGKYLPYAIMGMLLIYCLKDTSLLESPHGIPELIAIAFTAGMQAWKKQSLFSIISGTILYMVLMQFVF